MWRCSERRRQHGVALLTVLLVVALITMLATEMIRSGFLAVRRASNQGDVAQARQYAQGLEELGRQLLYADHQSDARTGDVDHLGEAWAAEELNFDFASGELDQQEKITMRLRILDLQGRFNVNNLIGADGRVDPAAQQRFQRLLLYLGLPQTLAERTVELMQAAARPERLLPLLHISQLRLLPGLEAEQYRILAAHVVALPPGTPVNVNTASEAVLIAYANVSLSVAELERIMLGFVGTRAQQPVAGLDAWLLGSVGRHFVGIREDLSVSSDHFQLLGTSIYRGKRSQLSTRVFRAPEDGAVLVRRRSRLPDLELTS